MTKQLRSRVVDEGAGGHDVVVVACFERTTLPDLSRLSRPLSNGVRKAADRGGWSGKEAQTATASVSGKSATTAVVRGLGKRGDLDSRKLDKWLRETLEELARDGFRAPLIVLPEHETTVGPRRARAILETIELSGYRFDGFLGAAGKRGPRLKEARVLPPNGQDEAYREGWKVAKKVAAATVTTRDLANTPPNVATPEWMADQARGLAEKYSMEIEVLDVDELERRGMGAILAVGGGSANPPRLVKLEIPNGKRTVSLVGKGVTFDTGGISLKPPPEMDEMKFDKCGACTVLGIAHGFAELDLPYHLRVYVPLAENMPDGLAYRPGDIVRCYNNKTVEVLNTDAEGRMILADALAWAAEEKPDDLLDYATLTGACVIALGQLGAGVFSPEDGLTAELLAAAEESGDYLWRLPLWPEFAKQIEGQHGDLRNIGVRWGGASTAAAFLANFVKGARRWAHLDIAGPAYVGRGDKKGFGATGYGVGLTLSWLLREAERSQ